MKTIQTIIFTLFLLSLNQAEALPIDWQGNLAFDWTNLSNGRFIEGTGQNSTNFGSQEISNNSFENNEATFQSYIFRLNPIIVVNDSVIIKSEISNGFARGGFLGDSTTTNFGDETHPGRYYNSVPSGSDSLVLNYLYTKIYGSTATYTVGRHPVHWGLGAILNNGDERLSRFLSIRDGLTAEIKLGKFVIKPFIARSFTNDSRSAESHQREYGGSLLYHSIESELKLGIFYSNITTGDQETQRQGDITNTGTLTSFGGGTLKLTDFYFEKSFNKIKISAEVPIFSGTIGNIFQDNQTANYDSKAFVVESIYKYNDQWSLSVNLGMIEGEDGNSSTFGATYLHPAYQIANVLFRYNREAIWNNQENIFDSSINNTNYLNLGIRHLDGPSTWNLSFTYATANEVAKASDNNAYNHTTGRVFNPTLDQSSDLGMEIDLDYSYKLNSEVDLDLNLGYFIPGDYFAYTNEAALNTVENSFLIKFGGSVKF